MQLFTVHIVTVACVCRISEVDN